MFDFRAAAAAVAEVPLTRVGGSVAEVREATARLIGLGRLVRVGDGVSIEAGPGRAVAGEIIGLEPSGAIAMAYQPIDGVAIGARAWLTPRTDPAPSMAWLGRVVDGFGRPVSGGAIVPGTQPYPLRAAPPRALARKRVGARLASGHAAFDTLLPICEGQRVGLFAGSGVGKSRLMAALAQRMSADVVVIGLIGERGREVREFVEVTLGAEAMKRAVVVVATSDEPAPVKRRAAWQTLAAAEYFRDQGKQVLLLFDSLTRFAEAHREVALTAGESASLAGFPPSTVSQIAGLVERAGPGRDNGGAANGDGDVTAVFTVLVAGSDMEEPVADMTRGVLDGHFILDRAIAERGRFPAIDARRSVSRSLPEAASAAENVLIARARAVLARYEQAAPMIQIGLYKPGADPETDMAVRIWPVLDAFLATSSETPEAAFERLEAILEERAA